MKSIIILLGMFFSLHTQAQSVPPPADLKLVSLVNFGLPALAVTNVYDKVHVVLDSALLNYSDKNFGFDQLENYQVELTKMFQMDRVSALIVSFERSDCIVDSAQNDVFYCKANGPRVVMAAETDFSGNVISTSTVSVIVEDVDVSVRKVITIEPGFSDTRFTVVARVFLPTVTLYLQKSNLAKPQF